MMYVVAGSHRAYDKLKDLTKSNLKNYYNLYKTHQITEIPEQFYGEALKIKGVRKAKLTDEWHPCIKW